MAGKVEVDRDSLFEALRDLEVIVPSLDNIGSSTADMSEDEQRRILSDFIRDWHVGRRLAEVRRLISNAFDYDELKLLFGDTDIWRSDHRTPKDW